MRRVNLFSRYLIVVFFKLKEAIIKAVLKLQINPTSLSFGLVFLKV